jgi:serine/threonine protein phosphatase PrpC
LLAISRAFGDTQFKEVGQEGTENGLVISVPEIYSEIITPMTEFAIIATDGLWDVINPQKAVQFVRMKLSKQRDLQNAAKELTLEALKRGSIDNVTVLLIAFHMKESSDG